MSVSLVKGQKVSLVKEPAPGKGGIPGVPGGGGASLRRIVVGLGWDAAERPAPVAQRSGGLFGGIFTNSAPRAVEIDCDASAILLQNGRFVDRKDLVYFGNLRHYSGAIWHNGDNLTGEGEGDDEQIVIDLDRVPKNYDRIAIVVNIYSAIQRKQDFGMISNAFVRIIDADSGQEFLRFDLSENYPGMTAMIFGEIYRYNGQWKFAARGEGTRDGSLSELAKRFA